MRPARYSLMILFLTLMVVNIGFGIILPILPYYAQSLGASATTLGLLSATYATLQFLFAPLWGRLSDRIGRRPVLLVGLAGFSLSFLVFGFADRLWMLFLARTISGLLSSATLPTALAYIADTTPPEKRARGMGLMGAAGGIGMLLGPAAGGFLAAMNVQLPFFTAAALALLVGLFAFFLLPESLKGELRAHPASQPARPNRIRLIGRALRGPLAFFMALAALTSFGMAQLESTGALYAKARFGAGELEMGAAFILLGALGVFAQFVLVARVIRAVGEPRAIQISLLGAGISFVVFGFARNYAAALAGVLIMGLTTAFLRPALNTLVSRRSPPSEQGAALGLVSSFYSLGMMFGPITGGVIFDLLGAAWPFFSAAMIHLGAVGVSALVFRSPRPAPARTELAPRERGEQA